MGFFSSSRSVLRLAGALLFAISLTISTACNAPPIGSPFSPIPPPLNPTIGPPTLEIDSAGVNHTYWNVTSPASPGTSDLWVYLTNFDMGSGAIVRAAQDGSYTTRVEGQEGDRILFGFGTTYGDTSWAMCRPLHEGLAKVPCQ